MRLGAVLEREQQAVDDGLALGLRLDGGEEARVDDRLGRLRGEYLKQAQLALREPARAVGDVDEADQLALYLQRHTQDGAHSPALREDTVESFVRGRVVGDESLAGLVERRVAVLAFELELELFDQP